MNQQFSQDISASSTYRTMLHPPSETTPSLRVLQGAASEVRAFTGTTIWDWNIARPRWRRSQSSTSIYGEPGEIDGKPSITAILNILCLLHSKKAEVCSGGESPKYGWPNFVKHPDF